jgi:hypothetical protein
LNSTAKAARRDKEVNVSAGARKVPAERSQFRKLILKNPNYFGTLKEGPYKPVKQIISNTTYEELTCIGYNQNFSTLEATIAIKLPYGYGGGLCSLGTDEYVRFFIDYGAGWIDAGVASVNVHDIADSLDCAKQKDKPLSYVLSLKIDPKTDYCGHPMIPKVRAILSWNFMPPSGAANADWPPVWGNVMECNIQVKPRDTILIDILKEVEAIPSSSSSIKILHDYAAVSTCPLPPLPEMSLAERAQIHNKADAHRFGLNEIHELLTNGAIEPHVLSAKVQEWEALGLDLQKAIDVLENTNANTDYEALECLGLNYYQDKLVTTLRIKRPLGYSGSLCKPGSFEYVAFWADWDNTCQWTFLGIKKLNVHDFEKSFPNEGICYSVVMPVDLSKYRTGCEKPKIARVRAVLSWNIAPSSTDPDELKYWGNRVDAHVQIRPGEVVNPDSPPRIVIGGIHINDIDNTNGLTTPDAKFAQSGVYADHRPVTPRLQCPFGGRIDIQGLDFGVNYIGQWYKIEVRNVTTGSSPSALNNAVMVQDWDGVWHFLAKVGDYYRIDPYSTNPFNILQRWSSSGDDLWEIDITIRTAPSDVAPLTYSITKKIQLDNTAPEADPSKWTALRNKLDIHIDSGGDCKKFKAGEKINGHFVAQDVNFGTFSLSVLPSVVDAVASNPVIPNPNTPYDPTVDPPGSTWSLDTSSPRQMKPCGYVVLLEAWDRSIMHSQPYSHNYNRTSVGFCLDEEI